MTSMPEPSGSPRSVSTMCGVWLPSQRRASTTLAQPLACTPGSAASSASSQPSVAGSSSTMRMRSTSRDS